MIASEAAMDAESVTVALLDASHGPAMVAINRACPIVSDLTFCFDRGEDFLRWPSLVYERFFYAGVFHDDRLVGYCMVGLVRAWTGQEFGWLAVLGDARMLPEHRGLGWIEKALALLADVVPGTVRHGVFIIKEGNRSADRLRARFRPEGYLLRPIGRLTAQNLFIMRKVKPVAGVVVAGATRNDLDAIVDLLVEEWRGRLLAPSVSAESLVGVICQPGLGWERTYVARRDGQVVGFLCAWDMGGFHATRVISYSLRANLVRGLYAAVRLILHDAAPLPASGRTFKSVTVTTMATRGGSPDILRALLVAVNNDHLGQGFHLMHVGMTTPGGRSPALRAWFRQTLCSTIHLISRGEDPTPPPGSLQEPYLDLALI